ncbi:LysR family transcriptional regulator [Paracoccus actinidiae]|uniref:LysR family transcriptional regulator n=1 Tax=Paracoccus actinidiae TaxID=3064531 RepID=UPI0027D2C399|nr:LysR family transcriptional regulator [Paracoccus sp. M09]
MNALFAFEAAGRLRNFSRAAEELNVTPAAVSRMMQRLEAHIGSALFRRSGNGVTLTEDGQKLFESTSRAMNLIDDTLTEIETRNRDADVVTISVSTAFTTHWLMPHMPQFKAAFPSVDLRFQLITGPLTGPVNDVDLGMRFVSGPVAGHRIFPIMPEVLLPVRARSYPAHDAFREGTIIRLSAGQPPGVGDPLSADGTATLMFSDYAIVVQAALLGQGVCWGWLNVISHWLCEGQLVADEGSSCHVTDRECCIIQRNRHSERAVVADVREWLIVQMQDDYRAILAQYPGLGIPALR